MDPTDARNAGIGKPASFDPVPTVTLGGSAKNPDVFGLPNPVKHGTAAGPVQQWTSGTYFDQDGNLIVTPFAATWLAPQFLGGLTPDRFYGVGGKAASAAATDAPGILARARGVGHIAGKAFIVVTIITAAEGTAEIIERNVAAQKTPLAGAGQTAFDYWKSANLSAKYTQWLSNTTPAAYRYLTGLDTQSLIDLLPAYVKAANGDAAEMAYLTAAKALGVKFGSTVFPSYDAANQATAYQYALATQAILTQRAIVLKAAAVQLANDAQQAATNQAATMSTFATSKPMPSAGQVVATAKGSGLPVIVARSVDP